MDTHIKIGCPAFYTTFKGLGFAIEQKVKESQLIKHEHG